MVNMLLQYSPLLLTHLESKNWDKGQFEKLVAKINSFFPEFGDYRIMIFSTHDDTGIFNSAIATMFPLDYPNSRVSEYEDLSSACKLKGDLHFAIYLRSDLFELDEIAQAINISHEFQHISQYINDKQAYFFGCIIRFLLVDKIPELKTPVEYDAERKSKIIAYELYGSQKIDEWIELWARKRKHDFFDVLKNIDVGASYNFSREVLSLWEENRIKEKIDKLKSVEKRTEDEETIFEMFDYANI